MKKLLATLLLLVSANVMADPTIGVEYNQTEQVIPTDSPGKIEITELFWYGCPHCYALEPILNTWVKKLPKDVVFKRVPGIPRQEWVPMAKTYYTMEALGVTDKLHARIFDAIHKDHSLNPLDDAGAINWIANASGLDRKKVEETYNSFSTNTKIMRAVQVFRASGATGVPTLIVDGKYMTSSTLAGSNEDALKVTDYLINKVRTEKK